MLQTGSHVPLRIHPMHSMHAFDTVTVFLLLWSLDHTLSKLHRYTFNVLKPFIVVGSSFVLIGIDTL